MLESLQHTLGARGFRRTITVPAFASTAATIGSLAGLSLSESNSLIGCKILGLCSDGTSRAALILGDSTASLPQYLAAGADYSEPIRDDDRYTYVKAASGGALGNVVVIFYSLAV
jgi:hypothetical protein